MEEETPTTGPALPVVRARTRPPRASGLHRRRLHDLLDRSADYRLTLMIAPAGSGKTTLLGQLVDRSAVPAAWYQASSDDHDGPRLLAQLAAAFDVLMPPAISRSWPTVAAAAAALDESLPGRAILVVDDAHLLWGTPAEAVVEQLVAQAPPGLAIVVAGRFAPTFNLSRLRVSGALLDIGPSELNFRSWEVDRLFRDVYGHALTPDDLTELVDLTHGWAAGLQLFHLAGRTKASAERRRLLRVFTGSAPVRDYLLANVFAALSPDFQASLVHTSVLGRVSVERCVRLGELVGVDVTAPLDERFGGPGGFGALAGLSELHDDHTCRHQPLWHAFLRGLLGRELATEATSWHLAAGRVHEEAGDLVEALEAYRRANAHDVVEAFVAQRGRQLADTGGPWPLELPPAFVVSNPWLQLALARAHVHGGRLSAAATAYEAAEAGFAAAASGEGGLAADADDAGAACCRRELQRLRFWADPAAEAWVPTDDEHDLARAGTTSRQQPDGELPAGESWAQLLHAALVSEPLDVVRRARGRREPEVQLVAGLAALLAGQLDDCRSTLADVLDAPDSSPAVLAIGRLARALIDFVVGEPLAANEARDAAAVAERVGVPWIAVAARAVLLATGQTGGPSDAVRWGRARDAVGDRWGALTLLLAGGLGALVRTSQTATGDHDDPSDWRGDTSGASALLEEVVDRSRAMGAGVIEGWALVGLAVAQTRGSHPEAPEIVALAEKTARSLGIPAVQAAAYTVAAVAGETTPGDAADYRAMASSLAGACSERGPMIVARLARATDPRRDDTSDPAAVALQTFVGRRNELAELWSRWEAADSGVAQCVRIEGETGVGKTALIAELGRLVEGAGGQVRWSRGVDSAPRYWPWRHVVRELIEDAHQAELALALGPTAHHVMALVPELGGAAVAPTVPHGDDQAVRLAEGIERLLSWATRRRPMLLVFDDAQRADLESLQVLRSVGLALRTTRVMIVVGCRDEEWSPAAAAVLGERALSSAVPLRGFSGDDLRDLVRLGVGYEPRPELVEAVGRATGGNPSFVDEATRSLRPHSAAGQTQPAAESPVAEAIGVPSGLRVLTHRRLEALSPLGAAAVQTGAMLEPRVDIELLGVCLEVPTDQLRNEFEHAARVRLVEPLGPGFWGFPNDGVRQVLAEGVADEAAAQIHLRAADHLEQRAGASMVVSAMRVAQHLLVAAAVRLVPPDRLVQWISAAANEAAAIERFDDSIGLCERALEVVGLGPAARGEVLYQLAQARRYTDGERAARTTFVTAANAARATRNASLLARAALGYGRTISELTVVDDTLVALLDEADRALPPGDGALRAQVEARLAGIPRGGQAGVEAQQALSTVACDRAYRVGDAEAVAAALDTWHATLWGADLLPARLDAAAEMARYAEEAGDAELLFAARRHRHHDLLELGDVAAADVELAAAGRLVRGRSLPSCAWRIGVMRAGRALLDGRFGEAERLAADALTAARGDDSPVPQEYFAVQMLLRSRELGRLQAFDAGLRRLDERRPEMAVWRAARAYVLSQTGRAAEARTELHRFLAEDLARVTHDVHWLPTMAFLGEVAATLRQESAVEQLYRVLMPWSGLVVICGVGTAVWGSVSRVLGQLAGELQRFDDAAVHFEDALARETRLGSGPLLARTKLAYGAMLVVASGGDRDGDRERQGRALVSDAVETADGYGMVGVSREGAELLADVEAATFRRSARPRSADAEGAAPGVVSGARPTLVASSVAVPSPTTALRCLGSYRFEVRGRVIDLGAMKPRVRAVLWLLSVNAGHAVHAETLIDALWPEAELAAGRRNLQVAISSLRQALEPGTKRGLWALLAREGDSYRLVMGDDVECDLRSFAQLIGEARNHRAAGRDEAAVATFERALSAYTGDLIPEAGPADWIVGPRDGLRQQAAGTALALAEMRLARSETAGAIAACERGLTVDRYRDELWRVLFAACEQDGNHVAAARARQQYDAVLAELGIHS